MLDFEKVRAAYRNAIPARQEAFKAAVADARRKKDHRDDMKMWYPREVLRLAKDETRVRLEMAANKVRALIDTRELDPAKTIANLYGDMFAGAYGMDKDPATDLSNAIEHAVFEVAGLWPPDQPNDDRATPLLKDLNQCWLNTSNEFVGELECYIPDRRSGVEMPPKQHETKPSLPLERALPAFIAQLAKLEAFKGRLFRDAESDEKEWEHFTQSLIEKSFGKPSSNLDKFNAAKWAGSHVVGGVSLAQAQSNFELRQASQLALLRSIIAELRLSLPSEDIKGVYAPGEEYQYYRDLSELIAGAQAQIFIADAYLDNKVFDLYVSRVSDGVPVRMITSKITQTAEMLANMYAKSKPLELRTSKGFHDRVIFLDNRGWVSGQSIKDAASTKPTYLTELQEPKLSSLRAQYETIWTAAKPLI